MYRSKKKICDKCPLTKECVTRRGIKEIQSTPYKPEYERMKKKLKTKKGKRTYHLRMQSVEPVFGSLQQYYGLRRIYVRGKSSAFKVMLMSASAFNVKKWLKNLVQNSEKYAVNSFLFLSYLIDLLLKVTLDFTIFKHMSYNSECQYVKLV